jgi:lipopolysaccharide export system protein LptA
MNLIRFFVFTALVVVSQFAMALKSDADKAVYIDSNTASYDDNKGVSIYTGKVVTVQGSLRIKSDKLVVHINEGEIEKMVFTGKPTRFRQQVGEGKEELVGEALTGEYYPKKNKLVLIEKAIVSQGSKSTKSKLIVYDSKSSIIKAGEPSSDGKRVTTVFKPTAKKQNKQ